MTGLICVVECAGIVLLSAGRIQLDDEYILYVVVRRGGLPMTPPPLAELMCLGRTGTRYHHHHNTRITILF